MVHGVYTSRLIYASCLKGQGQQGVLVFVLTGLRLNIHFYCCHQLTYMYGTCCPPVFSQKPNNLQELEKQFQS